MPRPKRAKVASTARVAKTSTIVDPAPRPQRVAKAQAKTVPKAPERFSDDSDGLVVKTTRPQRRMPWQPEPQKDADFTMTGALPADNKTDSSERLGEVRTPSEKQRRGTRKSNGTTPGSSTRKSLRSSNTRQSHSALAIAQHVSAQEDDSSGFGDHLLSFTSLDSNSPAHGTRPPSAIKVGATPAHENSILALTNFKRRPRQPSLLRMVQQTTDAEDNDSGDLDDPSDLDDSFPGAESTPLLVHKTGPGENTGNDSGVNLSSSGSRGTKRKLSPVVQVPRSSPPYDPPSDPDVAISRSSSPSLPEVVQSTEEARNNQEHAEPEIYSETMAPPMSSSDYGVDAIGDSPAPPTRSKQRAKQKTSAKATKMGASEGEETERPKRLRGRQKANPNRSLSTAKLQALLPRRRTRLPKEKDGSEVLSSEGAAFDSDQDELAMPPRRQHPTARSLAPPKPAKKSSRTAKKSATRKTTEKNTRTYGRPASSDKENGGTYEEDSDAEGGTVEVLTVKPSKGLEAIARKFEEIDDFEMEFESISYVTSSSPYR